MTTAIIPQTQTIQLIPADASDDRRSRLLLFQKWLDDSGRQWTEPDLAAYRDYLLSETRVNLKGDKAPPLSPASAKSYLATIRGRYADILKSNETRYALYAMTPADASPADKKAYVDEAITQLKNAIDPATAEVKITTKQDVADSEHLRLTASQANSLLAAPGVDTLIGLRDTALIALMLCTGIREAELIDLDVSDLRQSLGGELALLVRDGKGNKQRLIPYGDLNFCLVIVESWLAAAGISEGAVFRGFYKGGKTVRKTRLHKRAINQIMDKYPIAVNGSKVVVNPHDCRRTYARRLYEAGTDIMAIKDNLGHASITTTQRYIGEMDVDARLPKQVYTFDIGVLDRVRF